MVTTIDCVQCPFCGMYRPISKATFKHGDPMTLGIVSTRECRGKKGFVGIGTKTLRSTLPENQPLVDELVDMSSGIILAVMEENIPCRTPAIILKYQDLEKAVRSDRPADDELRFKLDDANKEISRLISRVNNLIDKNEGLGSDADDFRNEVSRLKSRVNVLLHKNEGGGFATDDLERKIRRLESSNRRLRSEVKAYEDASFV